MPDATATAARYDARRLPQDGFPLFGIYDTWRDGWLGDHIGWREWSTIYGYHTVEVAAKLNAAGARDA